MLRVNELVGFGALSGVSFTFVASAKVTRSATITLPAGIQQYDWIVLQDAKILSTTSLVVPSGFTNLYSGTYGTVNRMTLTAKEAVGNESGTSVTGMTDDQQVAKIAMVFRPSTRAKLKGSPVIYGAEGMAGASPPIDPALYNVDSAISHRGLCFALIGSTLNDAAWSSLSGHDGEITQFDVAGKVNLRAAYAMANGASRTIAADSAASGGARLNTFGLWQEFEPS